MNLLGRDTGAMRLPVVQASEATKKVIEGHLKSVGLL